MAPTLSIVATANMLAMFPAALAGFNAGSAKNVAVYWGQNSYNQGSGPYAQKRLAAYCADSEIDIIPLAFLNGVTPPITNFANAGDHCTAFPGTSVLNCPQIEEDIKICQSQYGTTIVLSLGGATYSQVGWPDTDAAESAAQMVWGMFGPVSGSEVNRPFGDAVVDGFDLDFESHANNLPAFAAKLRTLMDGVGGKEFYLTAAPQCVFPDAAVGKALDAVAFDFIMIQFYNNWCGVSNFKEGSNDQNAFNFDVWDEWAKGSKNPNVKILLGIPAAQSAGGGYTEGSKLKAAIDWSKRYSNFGGAMMWDMSQLYSNDGFSSEVLNSLEDAPTTTLPPDGGTTTTVIGPSPTGELVPHWGQCGGKDYTGPTQCQPPYKCVFGGDWWFFCQ